MSVNPLTSRQQQILDMIRNNIATCGIPPTHAEICTAFGFRSRNTADQHLRALRNKGMIEIISSSPRGIRLTAPLGLPVIGRVAAGNPILAEEHIETHYEISTHLFNPVAHYLLRVQGLSMRDAGIFDGDLLAVHRTKTATNGQLVVARIEDEVTVKLYSRRNNIVTLKPKNSDFDDIRVDLRKQEFVIEGLGVGVIRNGKLP